MKCREQLQQEIKQAESQLKLLEKSEWSKMKERNRLNVEILTVLQKKNEVEKELKKKREILRDLSSMTIIFK